MAEKEFHYEITERLSVLSENSRGWSKELNLVSWNDREPKLDLRDWNHEENKMGKGITLSREEAEKLSQALLDYLKA